jgi:hypothetical protein
MLKSWHNAGAYPAATGARTKAAARADKATENRIEYSLLLSTPTSR